MQDMVTIQWKLLIKIPVKYFIVFITLKYEITDLVPNIHLREERIHFRRIRASYGRVQKLVGAIRDDMTYQ
jgi:hypothetical protein